MAKVRVTLPDGRVVAGEITEGTEPLLLADGCSYSGQEAISGGLTISPVNDPLIDRWISNLKG